jgi:hypothetical protein
MNRFLINCTIKKNSHVETHDVEFYLQASYFMTFKDVNP